MEQNRVRPDCELMYIGSVRKKVPMIMMIPPRIIPQRGRDNDYRLHI